MNEHVRIEDGVSLREAEEFIWREAEILDRADYEAWLKLWVDGGFYVIPVKPDEQDFKSSLNIAYDDAHMRRMRVDRLQGGFAISATPAARTIRLASRFVPFESGRDFIVVRSAMHLTEDKFGRQRTFVANVEYRIERHDGELFLHDKIVRLINADGVLTSISYLF